MSQDTVHTGPTALRRAVATRARRGIAAGTLMLGLLAAAAVAAVLPAGERTLAIVAFPAHMLMSVTLPFLGVLLARDAVSRFAPVLVAAVVTGAATGLFGGLVAAAALAATGSGAPAPWANAAVIGIGGVLVQTLANLVGTGLGALIRPAWAACLATIVIPLGLWALLSPAGPAADWTTPFPIAGTLLSGEMDPVDWLRWVVVALIWGAGLNALAARRVRRRRPT